MLIRGSIQSLLIIFTFGLIASSVILSEQADKGTYTKLELNASTSVSNFKISTPSDTAPLVEVSSPASIEVKDLDINQRVQPVGVDDNNDFDVPSATEIGWYKYGSSPGEIGSTVMAAHVDFNNEVGVFFNLRHISIGSEISIKSTNGENFKYKVVDKSIFDKENAPLSKIFSRTGPDRLYLVTCGGEFDPSTTSYNGNVVIQAVPIISA